MTKDDTTDSPSQDPKNESSDTATDADTDASEHDPVSRVDTVARRRATKRRRRWIIAAAVVVVWGVVVVIEALLGIRDDSHGMHWVQEARNHTTASDVVAGSAVGPLRVAESDFAAGSGWLNTPLLDPMEILPVIGRQISSVRDLSSAAAQTARIAISALQRSRAILKVPHTAGPARIATLRSLAQLAATTDAELGRINPGTGHALLSPLASKHATFVKDLDQVRHSLGTASTVSAAVAGLLNGPQSYLVVMGNNSEMRDGSGMFLEVGVLKTDQGNFSLSQLQPTSALTLPVGKVPVGGELEARWGFSYPGVDWRNLGLTPQFDVNAPLAVRMWAADTGQHVDGVLAVDIETVAQLMAVTGPVTLADGTVVSAQNVVQYLMHNEYTGLSDQYVTEQEAQTEENREDKLGVLTSDVLKNLETQHLDLRALANAVVASAQGRHLMVWSAQSSAESAWETGGVAGQLQANSLLAGVINSGGNKLDQYLSVHATVATHAQGDRTDATLTVVMSNATPPGQDQFLAGPFPGTGAVYGEYQGILAVNVPGYASRPTVDGNPPLESIGPEGPTWVVARAVDVKPGQSQTVVIRFVLPGDHGTMEVLPSARLGPEIWTDGSLRTSDATPFTVAW